MNKLQYCCCMIRLVTFLTSEVCCPSWPPTPKSKDSNHGSPRSVPEKIWSSKWTDTSYEGSSNRSSLKELRKCNTYFPRSLLMLAWKLWTRMTPNAGKTYFPRSLDTCAQLKIVVRSKKFLQFIPWKKMLKMQWPGIASLCLSRKLF